MRRRDAVRIGLVVVLVLLLVFSRALATWLTDLWWYQHEGYDSVFWTLFGAQAIMGLGVGLIALISLGLTSWAVLRGRNKVSLKGPQVLEFRRSGIVPRLLPAVTGLLVLMLSSTMGLNAASHPDLLMTFVKARDFGTVDPLFQHDIGFYIFRVPLLEYLYQGAFVLLLLCLLVAVALHFAVRTIQVVPDQFMVSPQARRQLLGLLGGLFLLKAAGYWLDRYSLLYQQPNSLLGIPTVGAGAAYTDVHVRLPIFYLLMLLTLACAISLWLNRLPRHWRTSLAMVTVLVLVSFSGNVVLPVLTQKLIVKPNEQVREGQYLQWHIDFTRMAYNLDSIKEDSFPAEAGFTATQRAASQAVLDNIPLWDHAVLLKALQQAQEIRQYYQMKSVDNDRYTIDGQYRQTMLAARELSYGGLPTTNWITSHLTYTHGYGICMTAANEVEPGGNPVAIVKNIPPQGPDSLHLDKPQIYFGEAAEAPSDAPASDYCFVDTTSKEFDCPTNDAANDAFIHYDGKGGIPITSAWQKWLYFLRFGESNILLNADIGVGSRVMFYRQILERVSLVTPWVTYDTDPYIVVSHGQLYWIADGYTTSSYFPYSIEKSLDDEVPANYIRNSVKAVINAYDGSMQFYVSDPKDPIVATYADIFPQVFQPLSAIPADLQAHLRYPQQLFDIQANVYAIYHMKDTQNFFNRQDQWQVVSGEQPYYAMLKLAGGDREEFVLMLPFTPASKQNMVSWMAARCDSPHYGEMVVYEFPRQKNIYGPAQIQAQLNQNADISKSLTLWNQKGSHAEPGPLLVVPVGDSILYVQALYLEATEQKTMPQLVAVIVSDGNRLAMGSNLADAVNHLLGLTTTTPTSTTPTPAPASTPAPTSTPQTSWQAQVDQANQAMNDADTAQRAGDWAAYGAAMKRLRQDLQAMQHRGGP